MIQPRYIIGFCGHRSGFDEVAVQSAFREVLADLKARATKVGGQAELYSGVAQGTDTVFLETGRSLDMPVHVILPLAEEEFSRDFTSSEDWTRSQAQLDLAKQRPGPDSVHTVPGESTRPECYFNQAIHMLNAVDVLVVVWDGLPARGLGGTQQIADQAKAMGLPVIFIDPQSGKTSLEGSLEKCFQRDEVIEEFNAMAQSSPAACPPLPLTPDGLQRSLDAIAMEQADRFRPTVVRITLLHGAAAMLAAFVTFKLAEDHPWEKSKWIITVGELILVSIALWMRLRLNRRHIQDTWIRSRFACELMRGLRASIPILDPLHPMMSRHDARWRRFAISAGLLVMEHQPTDDRIILRDNYLSTRLSDTHPDGQILHYKQKRPASMRWWNFTGAISTWSAMLAPIFVLVSLICKVKKQFSGESAAWQMDQYPISWALVIFFPIVLPLSAGLATSLRHALDAGRRKERYPQMVERLTEIKKALPGLETRSTIRTAVTRAEEMLVDELMEWRLAMKKAGR